MPLTSNSTRCPSAAPHALPVTASTDEGVPVRPPVVNGDLSSRSTDVFAQGDPHSAINAIPNQTFGEDGPYQIYDSPAPSPDFGLSSMERLSTSAMSDQKQANLSAKAGLLHSVKLPKKPSFPSLFTPSFLQTTTPDPPNFQPSVVNESAHNHPLHSNAVPSLLDDDPFANLTSSSPTPTTSQSPPPRQGWPSLSESVRPSTVVLSPKVYIPSATRPKSSGHGQPRPAHTRPAFVPRPSLPSLHTLAQMNVIIPRKVRRGTVGARLPHEPWDLTAEPDVLVARGPLSAGPSETHNFTNTSQSRPTDQDEDYILRLDDSDGLVPSSKTGLISSDQLTTCVQAADEISSAHPRSFSMDDSDTLPSLSYTTSRPSSSTLSRSSPEASSPSLEVSMNQDEHANAHSRDSNVSGTRYSNDCSASDVEDDDLLNYHSDFDYYTRSLSDLSDFEPDASEPQVGRRSPRSSDVGITPYTSLYSPRADFEPGTSGGAMQRVLPDDAQTNGLVIPPLRKNDTLQDSSENVSRNPVAGRQGREGARVGGEGVRLGRSDDDKVEGHTRKMCSVISTAPDYSSSSDGEDGNTVYYSVDGTRPSSRAHSRTWSRHSKADGGSDDDIPLAQRMPTALTAQKSIRKQLRDERQQRKLERAKSTRAVPPPLPIEPPPALPASLSRRATHTSRQPSMSAAPARASDPLRRERSHPRPAPVEAFPAEDLSRKLQSLQVTSPPSTAIPYNHDSPGSAPLSARTAPGSASRSPSRGQHVSQAGYVQQVASRLPEASQDKPLRSMRSFHRPEGRYPESQRKPVEAQRLGRSMTTGARRSVETSVSSVGGSNGRSARNGWESGSFNNRGLMKSGRTSEDGRRPSASASRTSVDRENDVAVQRVAQRPPVPPLPSAEITSTQPQHPPSRDTVVQQRIFVGDMQRFNMVEIASGTNAGDVIDTVASQGMLDRSGSWMLFELAQDFGMERPIRNYELLADVSASWNKDKLLNAFVIKPTPLARILSPSTIPASSPTHRGWVEWESKRGKWSRRWMELREHSLWLSKRDTGKDEVFLCSLSNFDAYYVTRRHKSPKAFLFAIKSTDNPSLFENAADYLHVFSCNPRDGEKWMEAILVARSYVLYQERNVLFAKAGGTTSQAKPLTRTRTRKQSTTSRPTQPLVSVPPPFNVSAASAVAFEPGSLLAKRT